MGLHCITDSPEIPRTYVRIARESDIAWENDQIAYRVFGPSARAKVGNGIDVWAKSVDYPILDKWYKLNAEGKDYHVDRGEGSDFYNAGKQMGCGGIALWEDGIAYPPETYDTYKIVSNQNDQLAFELNYNTWNTPSLELKEHKRIEMVMGTQLFKVTSTIKSKVDRQITLAIGLSTFGKQKVHQDKKIGVLSVWETIDSANGNLGTAVLVDPEQIKGFVRNKGNEFVLLQVKTNQAFTYYTGAGWEKDASFEDMESWRNYVKDQAKKIGL